MTWQAADPISQSIWNFIDVFSFAKTPLNFRMLKISPPWPHDPPSTNATYPSSLRATLADPYPSTYKSEFKSTCKRDMQIEAALRRSDPLKETV
jgi:hypothetical protein